MRATKLYRHHKRNATEERFAQWLAAMRAAGRVKWWRWEPFKLRLGSNWKTTYTPDFMVTDAEGYVTVYEVKGFWRDDARVKIKVAEEQYPEFGFVAATERRKGGGWEFEEIGRGSAPSAPHRAGGARR